MTAAGLRLLDDRNGHLPELLHHFGIVAQQLQQAVGTGEAGGTTADNRHANFNPLVFAVDIPLDELGGRVNRWRVCDW